jgi:CBS domain-containing protein
LEEKTMTTVRHVLQEKGLDVWFVSPETTVLEASNLMFEKNVGALIIIDGTEVVGIFSERDIARKLAAKGTRSGESKVKDIMTPAVITVSPEQSVDECMALMTDQRVRHLPVIENHKIIGMISIGDVVKAIMSEREQLIRQLESYITGAR